MKWYTIKYINVNDHHESGQFNVQAENVNEAHKIGQKQIHEMEMLNKEFLEITHVFTSPYYN